ncbi:hypothetical protein Hypma_009894 [Hypsizygus marmoreus]|uniref:Uncharacterized protein n=1 Tax=Hypsizygus marmoreus TaxID=39966 RepID=A0A369JWK0_HYPMA|nr:hypothetical protein Hypma_009894 [Hypsizygus marmoreus]
MSQNGGLLIAKTNSDLLFNDEEKRKKLNYFVHPAVEWAMFRNIVEYWVRREKYCMIEGGSRSSAEIQFERLMLCDNSSID